MPYVALQVQKGCTKGCDGDFAWCAVENPGCEQQEWDDGGPPWAYCSIPTEVTTQPVSPCEWKQGDGQGKNEWPITDSAIKTKEGCVAHVRANRPAANGVTWNMHASAQTQCYAEHGMASEDSVKYDLKHLSCFFALATTAHNMQTSPTTARTEAATTTAVIATTTVPADRTTGSQAGGGHNHPTQDQRPRQHTAGDGGGRRYDAADTGRATSNHAGSAAHHSFRPH